ncbi:MAG: MYXO-CTERM sorting domain-containing protein [Saccharopolyspora rectivirgula]
MAPGVSVNRIVLGGQIALAVALVAFAVAFRRRR